MRRRPRRGRRLDPEPVGGAIRGVLADLGLEASARVLEIAACWPEVVGAEEARHAAPSVLRGRCLEVTVDSHVWCQHLDMRRDAILAGLRGAVGEAAPLELRLRVGRLESETP